MYLDTSVVLRRLFSEPDAIASAALPSDGPTFTSRLLLTEVARTIDRARLRGELVDEDVATLHEQADILARTMTILAVTDEVLERAGAPMPTIVGTLDGIHLATALLLKESPHRVTHFLTHDTQLGRAARASGFVVIGV
jgi:predicted nucleic acid-binding protein